MGRGDLTAEVAEGAEGDLTTEGTEVTEGRVG